MADGTPPLRPSRTSAVLLAGWILGGACAPPAPPPDLLLVTVDTLRTDFLSCYGYPRQASPTLEALASAGALFEAHFTTIATTAPAHASMFTGLPAREHGLTRNGWSLDEALPSLPAILRASGYRTGASIGARIVGSEYGFARGFDVFDEAFDESVLRPPGKTAKYERYAESVVDRAIAFAEADDGRPTFLWAHVYDPHEPYAAPRVSPLHPPKHLQFFRGRAHGSDLFERGQVARVLAGYEGEVTYADAEIGRLLAAWDARERGPDSLVVVVSDHGEGLGEHSYMGHGFLLYEEQMRVPFLLRMPGIVPGTRVRSVTSTVDLAATLVDLLGVARPEGLGGESLRPLLDGREDPERAAFAERRTYGEGDLQSRRQLRELVTRHEDEPIGSVGEKCAVVKDGWKLVWNQTGRHELYDLRADPDEAENVLESEPERGSAMLALVRAWRAAGKPARAAGTKPPDETRETQEMLDALGY